MVIFKVRASLSKQGVKESQDYVLISDKNKSVCCCSHPAGWALGRPGSF